VLCPSQFEADRHPVVPVFLDAFYGTVSFVAWDEARTV